MVRHLVLVLGEHVAHGIYRVLMRAHKAFKVFFLLVHCVCFKKRLHYINAQNGQKLQNIKKKTDWWIKKGNYETHAEFRLA